jgi:hypothetical protein
VEEGDTSDVKTFQIDRSGMMEDALESQAAPENLEVVWSQWSPDLHEWLEALHRVDMTLELAKNVWSDYKYHVKKHPEIAPFLPLMFRRLETYLFHDHVELLYSDIVQTGQLTTNIGRDMVQLYMKKNDLASASLVVADIKSAGLPVSGMTIGMLIRLHGAAGNEREVWQYFDEHVRTKLFQETEYPYLLGSLFLALSHLPSSNEHVLSMMHLMVSESEYHPNSSEHYQWLAENPDRDISEMPDFPMPPAVLLPPPDAFCFNSAFMAIKTLDAANIIWDYAQRLRRVTPYVYTNYILCLANIDVALAASEFRQYLLTTYAQKGHGHLSTKVRKVLIAKALEFSDLESLKLIIEEKSLVREATAEDVIAVCIIHIKRKESVEFVLQECATVGLQCGFKNLGHPIKGIILEYTKVGQPENAEKVMQYMLDNNIPMRYHHWTPVPLWYLHQWTSGLVKLLNSPERDPKVVEELRQLEANFVRLHEMVMGSPCGPSAFYIRVVSTIHPSIEFAQSTIDRAVAGGTVQPGQLVFAFKCSYAPFHRGRAILAHLKTKYHCVIAPTVIKTLIEWAVEEKEYEACFEIAIELFDEAKASKANSKTAQDGTFILGAWVTFFIETVLKPLGIRSHLFSIYRPIKYQQLTEKQLREMRIRLEDWEQHARKQNFQEKELPPAKIDGPRVVVHPQLPKLSRPKQHTSSSKVGAL